MKKDGPVVAVVGATGLVGEEMITTLEQRRFPLKELVPLASERSRGTAVEFRGQEEEVRVLDEQSFAGVDIALFSAGGQISRRFAPLAAGAGAVVIDNTSAFRMEKDVPLVVPEINPHRIGGHKGIIANPNCSTIQMLLAAAPLHRINPIRRIVVSTYQSVSGAGRRAMNELGDQVRDLFNQQQPVIGAFAHQIAFNLIPQIDLFEPNGFTKEEMKMVNETRKILEAETIEVNATAVRVPVFNCHAESVEIEMERPLEAAEARRLLAAAPGVLVVDDPDLRRYPMNIDCAGRDEVFVGRIRNDLWRPNILSLWVVSDNIRKGAALNAVQIAERLIGLPG